MERSSNGRYKKDKERYQFSEQQKRMEEAGWWGQNPTRVSRATASEWASDVISANDSILNRISGVVDPFLELDGIWFACASIKKSNYIATSHDIRSYRTVCVHGIGGVTRCWQKWTMFLIGPALLAGENLLEKGTRGKGVCRNGFSSHSGSIATCSATCLASTRKFFL